MFLWFFLTLLAIYYALQRYILVLWKRGVGELPPGPFPLPLLGNALSLDPSKPYESAEAFANKYGKLFTLMFGNQLALVITDLSLARKALKDDRFQGRPKTVWHLLGFAHGIVLSEGDVYREHRRFAMQALKDYGFGKAAGEAFIQKEAADLVQIIRSAGGKPMDAYVPFAATVSNVMSYMLFGDSFNTSDPRFVEYIQFEAENFRDSANGSMVEMFHWLRFVPPFKGNFDRLRTRVETMLKRLQELIDDHKRHFDPTNPRDYIDAFLVAQQSGAPSFTDRQLLHNIGDLYAASMETTTTFLRWAMLFMMLHPEVQEKARQEIDRVTGRSRPVTFADRAALPYVEATFHEVFRMANFGPFLVPHKTETEVDFEGYVLPKDTTVIVLSWHINKDPKLWKDVDSFKPERFLTADGALDSAATNNIISFSVGKRVCPGEQLARMEMLIFFSSILQNFTVAAEEGKTPSTVQVNGLALTPQPYLMRAIPRK